MKKGDNIVLVNQSNYWTQNYYTLGKTYKARNIPRGEFMTVKSDNGHLLGVPVSDFKLKIESDYYQIF